jgi:hypothetical protein
MSEHSLVPYTHSGTYLPAAAPAESCSCETLINMALVGAVVGGSAAAAHNALRMKRDEIELGEAMLNTGRTAIASAAANAVAGEGVLRLSVMFGVGAAMLYGLNRWAEGKGEKDV